MEMKYFIIIVLLQFSIFSLYSRDDYGYGILINNKTKVYKTYSRLSSEEVLEKLNNNEIKPIKNNSSQGLSNAYFWLTFRNIQREKGENFILELNSPHIDTAALYLFKNGKTTLIAEIGDQIPFSKRPIFHPKLLFPLPNIDSAGQYLLLIDKQGGSANFPLYLWEKNSFEYHNSREILLWYVFIGAFLFFTTISILLAFIFKKPVFYYYSFFVFIILCYNFITAGFSFAFIYPENIWLNDQLRFLILPVFGLSFTLFTKNYFEVNRAFPKIEIGSRLLVFIFILLTYLGLFSNPYTKQFSILLISVLYFSLVLASIWSIIVIYNVWERLKDRAILFLVAFSGNISVLIFNLFTEYGLVEKSIIRFNPIFIANIQEIVVMTVGMYFYINKVKEERNDLRIEKDQRSEKEIQIKEQIQKFFSRNTYNSNFFPNKEENKLKFPYLLKDKSTINLYEVLYIESMDHYLTLYLMDRIILERKSIKNFFESIDIENFVQVHKSFVVNKDFIKSVEANKIILSNNQAVPLSRTYKAKFPWQDYLKIIQKGF
jgi:hypothetical protein